MALTNSHIVSWTWIDSDQHVPREKRAYLKIDAAYKIVKVGVKYSKLLYVRSKSALILKSKNVTMSTFSIIEFYSMFKSNNINCLKTMWSEEDCYVYMIFYQLNNVTYKPRILCRPFKTKVHHIISLSETNCTAYDQP